MQKSSMICINHIHVRPWYVPDDMSSDSMFQIHDGHLCSMSRFDVFSNLEYAKKYLELSCL